MRKCFLLLLMAVIHLSVYAQQNLVAFKGALIYTGTGRSIPNGVLIVQNGKIITVGDATTTIPANAQVVDMTGKVIMPGIVDTHSHIGGPEGGDRSSPLNPDIRVLDAVNPTSKAFKKALAGGLTTVNIMPGSGQLMSGQTIYVKLREATTIEDLLLTNERGV